MRLFFHLPSGFPASHLLIYTRVQNHIGASLFCTHSPWHNQVQSGWHLPAAKYSWRARKTYHPLRWGRVKQRHPPFGRHANLPVGAPNEGIFAPVENSPLFQLRCDFCLFQCAQLINPGFTLCRNTSITELSVEGCRTRMAIFAGGVLSSPAYRSHNSHQLKWRQMSCIFCKTACDEYHCND